MFEMRRMSQADIDDVAMFTARIFAPNNVEGVWQQLRMAYHGCPFMRIDQCFALTEDGQVVFQWQLLDYTMRIGRAQIRAAGCFGLASAQGARGQHLMLKVAELGRPIPAGEGFEVLLGFAKDSRAFLQMDGTVAFGPEYRWAMPVTDALPDTRHGFRAASDADTQAMVAWHNTSHTGLCNIVRTEAMWPWMLRKPPEVFVADAGYIGLRQLDGKLEIREVAGSTPAFYARALAFACALARERGIDQLTGHLPPDHPFVEQSYTHAAHVSADYTQQSGSFIGLMRPQSFMEKMACELEHRWATRFGRHRLTLHVTTYEGESLDIEQVYNRDAPQQAELHLDIWPGWLMQMCLGYASARSIMRRDPARAKAWMSVGDLPVDAVLDALFPKQTPFIVHGDRY